MAVCACTKPTSVSRRSSTLIEQLPQRCITRTISSSLLRGTHTSSEIFSGRIARNNALFAHLFQNVLKGEAGPQGRTIRSVVADSDRAGLDKALAAAAKAAKRSTRQ